MQMLAELLINNWLKNLKLTEKLLNSNEHKPCRNHFLPGL